MNAHALLTSQGWRGTGHSLHSTSDSIGLSRPLLVSKKDNVLGLGKKQHKTADMWWMNAFDASLKGLDTSKEGQVKVESGGGLDMVVKGGSKWVGGKGGLYSFFVRGEGMGGTIGEKEKEGVLIENKDVKEKEKEKGKGKGKKKGEERLETKEERRARKAKKRAEKARKDAAATAATAIDVAKEAAELESVEKVETKEERKERKRQKKLLRQAEKDSSDTSSSSEKSKKKKRRSK